MVAMMYLSINECHNKNTIYILMYYLYNFLRTYQMGFSNIHT